MPEISVIMPVYNTREDFLREAIQSIQKQTFEDFELIIVNDGSTDKHVEDVIKSYEDERIKYFYKENGGAASARNLAISKAQGKYIAFLDSDDVAYPERFAKQYAFLENNPEIGCLGTRVSCTSDTSNNKMNFPSCTEHEEIQRCLIFKTSVFCQSSVMLRREILDKNHITYRDEYIPSEDYALWLDLVGHTKFAVLNEELVAYRYYDENISHRQNEKQTRCSFKAQINKWKELCDYKELDVDLLVKFCMNQLLTDEEISKLSEQIEILRKRLDDTVYSSKGAMAFLKKRFKRFYYRTQSLSEQIRLWKMPLNNALNIPLSFRLFCLITRGVL